MRKLTRVEKIQNILWKEKGFTRNLEGREPQKGYMVAIKENEKIFDNLDEITDEDIQDKLQELKQHGETAYFGGWLDDSTGKVYLDISFNFDSLDTALEVALNEQQKAIWDVRNQKEITL